MLQQLQFIPQTSKRNPLTYPRNGLLMCKSHHSLFDSYYFFLRYRMEEVSFCETLTNSPRTESIISSMPPMSNTSNNSMDGPLILTRIHHMPLIQTFSFTMKLFVVVDGIKIMKPISSLARPAPRYILPPPPHQFTEASLSLLLPLHCCCPIPFHPQVSPIPPRK
jgi:HNH endonuclease